MKQILKLWNLYIKVDSDDILRVTFNQLLLVIVAGLAAITIPVMFVAMGFAKEIPLALFPILFIVYAICIYFTRKGELVGAYIIVGVILCSVVFFEPSTYAGVQPAVHTLFLVPIALAIISIGSIAGFIVIILEVIILATRAYFADIPVNQILIFCIVALTNISASSFPFMLLASYCRRQLRDLEYRVSQRTYELELSVQDAENSRREAIDASAHKTKFLAVMSHELRTPLNAVINGALFVKDEPLTDDQTTWIDRVVVNGRHLLGLINDILDLVKVESGEDNFKIEPGSLTPVLNGVYSLSQGLLRGREELSLIFDIPEQEELPNVMMNEVSIRRALFNLISNAVKFTENGTITVVVKDIGDEVLLSVSDTGIGIGPEHFDLVFEEFRQVEDDSARQYQGTGLGLPISKKIVERHGGRMWLESKVGVGSTFFFTLPVAERTVSQ